MTSKTATPSKKKNTKLGKAISKGMRQAYINMSNAIDEAVAKDKY